MWYYIPGAREGELAIRGDNNVTKKVGVILQSTMWNAIVALVPGQLPYNNKASALSQDTGSSCLGTAEWGRSVLSSCNWPLGVP